ncbi:TadE/TadG family type IV pilus assembly protein [Planotetraspora kaengkrachanensis]|uniref:Membrane protein n=1 Tax=Planotetraspora kaengkrachanensis TaxID=575193 RepID=A0A8J3LVR1_9ACTN|nr:TadE/TadG family type IV pilus assembly protein [Planotetraspora kaengkrachanensis]GIG79988.1 membrane protein [Planotetraspora kaengkrachanensis]
MTLYSDRGSVALETAIIAPAMLAMLVMMIALGRIAIAHGAIDAASRDAARQASIARNPDSARSAALSSAQAALMREGLACSPSVDVDTRAFSEPVGKPAAVTATVTCEIDLADIALPGMPGSKTLTSSFASPIDPFRARGDQS